MLLQSAVEVVVMSAYLSVAFMHYIPQTLGDGENARPENDGQRKLWVWKMQEWKMTDKLAGTRVSVLSVLTLWPLCQMTVRCVTY